MSKSTYSAFKSDADREVKGIILDLGDAGKFRIARSGGANKAFEKKLSAVTKPHRRAIQTETMNDEVAQDLVAQVYAETVVLGWEGVTDEEGKPLAFNVENCKKLLLDLPDLRKEIQDAAAKQAYFREEILEGDVKN